MGFEIKDRTRNLVPETRSPNSGFGLRAAGSGFRVSGSGGSGSGLQAYVVRGGSVFRVPDSGFRIPDSGFSDRGLETCVVPVWGSGFRLSVDECE